MTEPDPDVRISLDDCANLVEFTINDFVSPKHLQERILEQEKTIKDQQLQLEILTKENNDLKELLAKHGISFAITN